VRANAGILLSAAAIATSFLGGAAIRDGHLTILAWVAIALFAALCACTFAILWPRDDWEFVAGPRRVIATYIEGDELLPVPRIHRDLALHMEESYDANQWRLTWLARFMRTAILFLGVEVLAWFLDLGTRS
jgi:hypothetical protein